MAVSKFTGSATLNGAIALVLEQNPDQWGANEHLNMIRYLVLGCSDKSKLPLAEIKALKPETVLTVKWGMLRDELNQSGKLAECANLYKWLQENGDMAVKKSAKAEYA